MQDYIPAGTKLSGEYLIEIPGTTESVANLEKLRDIAALFGQSNGGIKIIILAE